MQIYKKGDSVDIKGMGTVQTNPHQRYHGRSRRVFSVTQHALGIVVNKQVKRKILAKRIDVYVEHIKHSEPRQLPKTCEGKQSRKEGSRRERYLDSTEAPACSTQKGTMCENQWEEAHTTGTYSL